MTPDLWLWVGGIFLSGLISWIVARHYYRRSEKKRAPTFITRSVKTLVDSTFHKIGGFSVVWKGLAQGRDMEVGTDGISEATIIFWNSGTLPILAEEILEPYTVTMKNVPILEYSILKASRAVVGPKLTRLGDDGDRLELGFSVLEPGDSVTIKIVFDGPHATKIVFSGACLECRKPMILPPDPIYSVPVAKRFRDSYKNAAFFVLTVGGGCAGAFGLLGGIAWTVKKLFGEHVADMFVRTLVYLFLAFLFLMFVALIWEHFKRMTAPYLPPDIEE